MVLAEPYPPGQRSERGRLCRCTHCLGCRRQRHHPAHCGRGHDLATHAVRREDGSELAPFREHEAWLDRGQGGDHPHHPQRRGHVDPPSLRNQQDARAGRLRRCPQRDGPSGRGVLLRTANGGRTWTIQRPREAGHARLHRLHRPPARLGRGAGPAPAQSQRRRELGHPASLRRPDVHAPRLHQREECVWRSAATSSANSTSTVCCAPATAGGTGRGRSRRKPSASPPPAARRRGRSG